jgi:hypothetical protein
VSIILPALAADVNPRRKNVMVKSAAAWRVPTGVAYMRVDAQTQAPGR